LSFSSHCIEDWAFSEKSIYFIAIIFSVLFPLHNYTPKTPKHIYFLFHVKLANKYLQLLMGSTTFSILKGTTIDLLHLGVISKAPAGRSIELVVGHSDTSQTYL
jgi:hypothetical protein